MNQVSSFRELRELRGMSQRELAEALGVTQTSVARFEARTNHRVSALRRYVKALGGELDLVLVLPTGHRMRVVMGKRA